MRFQGFNVSMCFIDSDGNKIELGKVANVEMDFEEAPIKAEFKLDFQPPPYNIYWTLLTGYPMLTRYMGAN